MDSRTRACLLMALLPLLPVPGTAAEPASAADLEIGIAPYLPARTLVQNYQPLRDFLEQKLRQPVLIVSAPDYRSFHERIRQQHYPLVITVAHSAYLAQTDSGYHPLLRPRVATRPTLVASHASPFRGLRELRGQSLALPDPLAVISMQAGGWLREAGLEPGRDLQIRHHPNHSAAVNHVASGQVAAAIVSDRALLQMPADTRAAVRIVQTREQDAVPGVVYLAHPQLAAGRREQLKVLILEFSRGPVGRRLMQAWGYDGLVPATDSDLAPLAAYGRQLRAALHTDEKPAAETE